MQESDSTNASNRGTQVGQAESKTDALTLKLTRYLAVLAAAFLIAVPLRAQEQPDNKPAASSKPAPIPWTYSLTTSGYIVPGGQSYVSPDFTADRRRLHLEARYNSEAYRVGSVWIGRNINKGKNWVLNLTLMGGALFGDQNGLTPGCNITFTHKKWQIYATADWPFDLQDTSQDNSYLWAQLTYSPRKWMQVGFVTQRPRTYSTGLTVQRGVLIGFTRKNMNFTTSIFNFGWITPTEVLALGFSF